MVSIKLPALAQLPEDFKFFPATEYHYLVHLCTRYYEEAAAIGTNLALHFAVLPTIIYPA